MLTNAIHWRIDHGLYIINDSNFDERPEDMVGFDIHVGSVNPHLSIEVPLNISIDYFQIH